MSFASFENYKTDTLIVSFSSSADINSNKFELFKIFNAFDCSVLLFKSTQLDWYLNSINDICQTITEFIMKFNIKKVYGFGICSGGFAALVTSGFIQFDKCLLFSPNIDISEDYLNQFHETGFTPDSWVFNEHKTVTLKIFSSQLILNKKTSFELHVADENKWDNFQCLAIENHDNFTTTYHKSIWHHFFQDLYINGDLQNIIKKTFNLT